MWIAKNSVTGKTYGKKFSSIYDCQAFIDKELVVLEYQFRHTLALEKHIEYHIECMNSNKSFMDLLVDAVQEMSKEVEKATKPIVENVLGLKSQKELDNEITNLAIVRWQKNNIIRCWYVEQERFADGFDF